jgi:hypothetical protein
VRRRRVSWSPRPPRSCYLLIRSRTLLPAKLKKGFDWFNLPLVVSPDQSLREPLGRNFGKIGEIDVFILHPIDPVPICLLKAWRSLLFVPL